MIETIGLIKFEVNRRAPINQSFNLANLVANVWIES